MRQLRQLLSTTNCTHCTRNYTSTTSNKMTVSSKVAWTKLHPKPDPQYGSPCSRSSHGLSIVQNGSRLILYGGEHIARTPINDSSQSTWAADLQTDQSWKWRTINTTNSNQKEPEPRVAHAQAVYQDSIIYTFGGRAGITMQEQAMNDLWKLDCSGRPGTEQWSRVEPNLNGGDDIPSARSFHKMVCCGDYLYVFGGCSAHHGRCADIHKYDILNNTWHDLGTAPLLKGRGGPNFLPFASESKLGVVAGFVGEESNDGQFFFMDTQTWDDGDLNQQLEGLRPRSVSISASFPSVGVSTIFGGEVDPSDKGHEGAGAFENDLVLLEESSGKYLGSTTFADTCEGEWPEARGWSDGAAIDDGHGNGQLYIFGGLSGDDTNPIRLDDLWRLDIQKA